MCDDNLSWFSTSLTSHPSFVISLLFHISHFHTTATMLSTLNWSEKSWKFTIFTFNLHCYKVLSLFSLSLQLNLLCMRETYSNICRRENKPVVRAQDACHDRSSSIAECPAGVTSSLYFGLFSALLGWNASHCCLMRFSSRRIWSRKTRFFDLAFVLVEIYFESWW